MLSAGIDVGSTYTKYCIMSEDKKIVECFKEVTPIHQKAYFEEKIKSLKSNYGEMSITSCGYGKGNVDSDIKCINELVALARGINHFYSGTTTILDIGGQDTKLIRAQNGKLLEFFINDRCAAGSGMFLLNTLRLLELAFSDIDLSRPCDIHLSSVCAVFAQSEIVGLIAQNKDERDIVVSVVNQILIQAKSLLSKLTIDNDIILSGGFTKISNIDAFSSNVLDTKCSVGSFSEYYSAIGCALSS